MVDAVLQVRAPYELLADAEAIAALAQAAETYEVVETIAVM